MTGRGVKPVRASAPLRVDLAGGTLDLWPLGLLHPGAVTVAVAISLRASAEITPRRGDVLIRSLDLHRTRRLPPGGRVRRTDPLALFARLVALLGPARGADVAMRSPVRAGSGLGTSSALGVTLAAALLAAQGRPRRAGRIVALVRDVEAELLGIPTGTQDHWAAWRGGIVRLHHRPAGPEVTRAAGPLLAALRERLLVIDTGRARSSAPSNWDMFRRRIAGEPAGVRAFGAVARAGMRAAEALDRGDWPALGRAMRRDLAARAGWSPLVLPPDVARILRAARRAGAWGERVCGAGGGGFGVALVDPERRARVADAVREAGGAVVPAVPVATGVRLGGG